MDNDARQTEPGYKPDVDFGKMETVQERAFRYVKEALEAVQDAKPKDRSPVARSYAVVATMLEQAVASFDYWITRDGG